MRGGTLTGEKVEKSDYVPLLVPKSGDERNDGTI